MDDSKLSSRLLNEGINLFPHTCLSVQPLHLARSVISCLLKEDLKETMDLLVLERDHSPDESQPSINYMIGRILLQIDSAESAYQAYEHYQLALNMDSTKPYMWISMGSLYLKLGQVSDALSAYLQAISLITKSPETQVSTVSTSSMAQPISETNLGALAWFGISQAYISTREISSAIEPLAKSMQLLRENDSRLQLTELESLMKRLSAYSSESHKEPIELDITIVDVPLQCLLDFECFKDSEVFQVESRIEKEMLIYSNDKTYPINSSIPSSCKKFGTFVANQSNDIVTNKKYNTDKNKCNSKSESDDEKSGKRCSTGIKIEKTKSRKYKHKKRTDIFRRACVSDKRSNSNSASSSGLQQKKRIHLQQPHSEKRSSSLSPSLCPTSISSPQRSMHSYPTGVPVHEQPHSNIAFTNPFYSQMVPVNSDFTASTMSRIVQSGGFSPSPAYVSLYQTCSDGSLRSSYNNPENGMPLYSYTMLMPQIPNPLYHSQRPRFVTNPLSSSMVPILSAQQAQSSQMVMGRFNPSEKFSFH